MAISLITANQANVVPSVKTTPKASEVEINRDVHAAKGVSKSDIVTISMQAKNVALQTANAAPFVQTAQKCLKKRLIKIFKKAAPGKIPVK